MLPNTVIYRSLSSCPFTNLAFGTFLTRKLQQQIVHNPQLPSSKILFLCSSSDSVMIGRNQNCWKECDVKRLNYFNIPLIRRDTGGGACFVDGGNLLFSFIEQFNGDIKARYPTIVNALKRLGINAKSEGRNDIVVDGKKISGSAFTIHDAIIKHHGTILVNANQDHMTRYLTPDPLKLRTKGIDSVRSRVANLTQFNPAVTNEMVADSICESFTALYGKAEIKMVDEVDLNVGQDLFSKESDFQLFRQIKRKFMDPGFIYNDNVEGFTHCFTQKFDFGLLSLYCEIQRDRKINKSKVYSDILDLELATQIQEQAQVLLNEIGDWKKQMRDIRDLQEKLHHDHHLLAASFWIIRVRDFIENNGDLTSFETQ